MEITRRQFIAALPALAALAAMGAPLRGFASTGISGRSIVTGAGASVCLVDLASGHIKRIPVGFMPHSFVRAPQAGRLWAIERWDYATADGVQDAYAIAEIDTIEGRLVRQMKAPAASGFFGHAFFTADGATVFVSRVDFETGTGHLTGYDVATWKQVADHVLQAGAVHECCQLDDGSVLAVCSGIRPQPGLSHLEGKRVAKGALIRMELGTGRIIARKEVPHDTQVAGHCQPTPEGGVFVLARPRPNVHANGRIYFSSGGDEPLSAVDVSASKLGHGAGERLSIALDSAGGKAVVTNPGHDTLTVLDSRTGAFLNEVVAQAKAVAFDPSIKKFIATFPEMLLFDAEGNTTTKVADGFFNPQISPFDSPHNLLL